MAISTYVRRSLRNSTQSSCTSNLSRSWSNSWNNLCSNSCNTQCAEPGKRSAFVFAAFYRIDIMLTYSHCLQKVVFATGNHPRPTHNSHLHYTLNMEPISIIIHRLTTNFLLAAPYTPNPSPTNRKIYFSRLDKCVQEI